MISLKNTLIYTFAGICFFGTAEMYMRHKGYMPEPTITQHTERNHNFDPVLGWRDPGLCEIHTQPKPSEKDLYWHDKGVYRIISWETPADHQVYSRHWADGSRASRPTVRKNAPYRVLLLGCSNTYGIGVEDWETYAWLLNERFPNLTIDNFAIPGYSTYQCLLREEQLLDKQKYDLVIYAGIEHHLLRNITYCHWKEKDFDSLFPPLSESYDERTQSHPNVLKTDEPMWYYPTVYLKSDNTLGTISAYRRWPGDSFLALINTAKRLFIYHESRYKNKNDKYAKIGPIHKEIFRQLLERMNECAQRHGSKFAVIMLENYGGKNITFEQTFSFPYVFATNGHNGEEDGPKFHVAGNVRYHGNFIVHKNWADNINKHLEEWYKQDKTEKTEAKDIRSQGIHDL